MDSSRYISRNNGHKNELISSPVYDDNTSNSTLSAASPDSAYTPYNSNDSRHSLASTQSWLDKNDSPASNKVTVRPRMSKINSHVSNFKSKFVDAEHDEPNSNAPKVIMSKIDISSRRELFEREQKQPSDIKRPIVLSGQQENAVSIKERLTHLERYGEECRDSNDKSKSNRSSGNFDEARYSYASSGSESQFVNIEPKTPKIDVQIVPLKERLMTLELSMGNETPSYNNKIEQRPAKRAEPKLNMAVTEPRKSIRSIDEQQQSMHKSKHADDRSSLASHPPQSKNRTPPTKLTESSNQVARKPEVLPRRQITPDLVKVTALAETEDDLLQLPEEIDDEADNSVSVSSASSKAIIPNLVNLTIKSILVNSIELNKASSTLSTSTLPLVVGTTSTECNERNEHSSSKNNPNGNHKLNETQQPVVVELQSKQCTDQNCSAMAIDTIDSNGQAKSGNESVQGKNERIKCQIVGVLEKNKVKEPISALGSETMINISNVLLPTSTPSTPSTPSPKMANKSPAKSPNKTKNIFDFFKRNFLNESTTEQNVQTMDDGQLNVSLCESESLTASVDTVDGSAHNSNDASN